MTPTSVLIGAILAVIALAIFFRFRDEILGARKPFKARGQWERVMKNPGRPLLQLEHITDEVTFIKDATTNANFKVQLRNGHEETFDVDKAHRLSFKNVRDVLAPRGPLTLFIVPVNVLDTPRGRELYEANWRELIAHMIEQESENDRLRSENRLLKAKKRPSADIPK